MNDQERAEYGWKIAQEVAEEHDSIGEYRISLDHLLGQIEFSDGEVTYYATPFYEGFEGIPIPVYRDGRYQRLVQITFNPTGDLEDDTRIYTRKLCEVLGVLPLDFF